MNPILAAALAEAEAKGLALLLDSITLVVDDVLKGKDIVSAFQDLTDSLAEKQAVALDSIVSP